MLKIILFLPFLAFANNQNENEFNRAIQKYSSITKTYNMIYPSTKKPVINFRQQSIITSKINKENYTNTSIIILDESKSIIQQAEQANAISDRFYLATTQIKVLLNNFYNQYTPFSEDLLKLLNAMKMETQNRLNELKIIHQAYTASHLLKSFKLLKYKTSKHSNATPRNKIINAINTVYQTNQNITLLNEKLTSNLIKIYKKKCTELLNKNKKLVAMNHTHHISLDLSLISTNYIENNILSETHNLPANKQNLTAVEKIIIAIQDEDDDYFLEQYRTVIRVIMNINSKLKSKIRSDKTLKDHAKDAFGTIFFSKKKN